MFAKNALLLASLFALVVTASGSIVAEELKRLATKSVDDYSDYGIDVPPSHFDTVVPLSSKEHP